MPFEKSCAFQKAFFVIDSFKAQTKVYATENKKATQIIELLFCFIILWDLMGSNH